MANEEDAPPAVPEWEPSELAKRIGRGHAHIEHFPDLDAADLARLIQDALDRGESKSHEARSMYWDDVTDIVVIVNPADPDGGTAVRTERRYFDAWGKPSKVNT